MGEGDEQDGIGDGDTDGHDGAHEALQVQGGASEHESEHHTEQRGRDGGEHHEGEADALEIGDEEQEDGHDGDEQSGLQAALKFFERRHLTAQCDTDSGGSRVGCDDFFDLLGDDTERLVVKICGDGNGAGHVVAVVLADDAAFADLGDVAQGDGWFVLCGDGQVAQVFEALHECLRYLDLERVTDAGFGIGPEVWHGEAAAGGCCHKAARGVTHLHTEQAGALAVDLYIDAGIVQGLAELYVA